MKPFKIVAVRKNSEGDISNFKLDNAMELDYDHAVQMAKSGQIENVDVFNRAGREVIRSKRDGSKDNNLDNLPPF